MSMTGITSYYVQSLAQQNQAGQRTAFNRLSQAITSGDLDAAKNAFAALPQNSAQGQSGDAVGPVATALNEIGTALNAGDLTAAQNALSAMKPQGRAHGGGPPPPPMQASDQTDTTTIKTLSLAYSDLGMLTTSSSQTAAAMTAKKLNILV